MTAEFLAGYYLAMTEGLPAIQSQLLNHATEIALQRLDSVVEERAQKAGLANPRPLLQLQQKQDLFRQKLALTTQPEEKLKYQHYLELLEWVINASGLHQN